MKPALFDESGLAAIYPGAWERVQAVYRADGRLTEPQAAALRAAAAVTPVLPPDGIAVIKVHGVITKGSNLFSMMFGGTSLYSLQADLLALRDDNSIRSIVLHIDSPGGGVYALDETCDVIAEVSKRKRVVAFTDGMCASAAYWLASACDRIVATSSAELGSIGVYAFHFDHSGELKDAGIVPTLVKAGEHKASAHPYAPLSAEDEAAMQSRIDAYYSLFTKRVARGRGVSVEQVRGAEFGEGRVVGAPDAVSAGMADEIGTCGDVLRGITRETSTRAALAADSLLSLKVRAASVA
jgi:signal peptide peptidase SppA